VDSVLGEGDPGTCFTFAHLIHALSLDDGTERDGWPVDTTGLVSNGNTFDPTVQHQRGALNIAAGMLYVPYGSLGDCGGYHGWIIGVPLDDPSSPSAYSTPTIAAGIWGTSGVAADDGNIFVATGNGDSAVDTWLAGDAVMRFPAGVPLPSKPADVYAPTNWHELDQGDTDLSGSGVLLIDLPQSTPSEVAMVAGKDGYIYLLDQANLGGVAVDGSELAKVQVATRNILTSPAVFTTQHGTFVAIDVQGSGSATSCPPGQGGDLIVFQIVDGAPPTIRTQWCAVNHGHGAPMVTTIDGVNDPIVWVTADSSQQLHAYDGGTGELLFDGGDDSQAIAGLLRFNTTIAVNGRVIVGANSGLYAFTVDSTSPAAPNEMIRKRGL
jgi:outer membrane protein assembly factor BamB